MIIIILTRNYHFNKIIEENLPISKALYEAILAAPREFKNSDYESETVAIVNISVGQTQNPENKIDMNFVRIRN